MLTLGKPLGNFDSVLTSTSAIGLQRRVVNNFQGGNRELRQHWLHKLQEVKEGGSESSEIAAPDHPIAPVIKLLKGNKDDGLIILGSGRTYRGSCTVWHCAQTGEMCSTTQSFAFLALWNKAVWELEDRTHG